MLGFPGWRPYTGRSNGSKHCTGKQGRYNKLRRRTRARLVDVRAAPGFVEVRCQSIAAFVPSAVHRLHAAIAAQGAAFAASLWTPARLALQAVYLGPVGSVGVHIGGIGVADDQQDVPVFQAPDLLDARIMQSQRCRQLNQVAILHLEQR